MKNYLNKMSLTLLLAPLLLTSCITIGKPFPISSLRGLSPYKTTKFDISKKLGEPYRVGLNNGKLTWTYLYYNLTMFGKPATKDLIFTFDGNGKMTQYIFNTSDSKEKEQLDNSQATKSTL